MINKLFVSGIMKSYLVFTITEERVNLVLNDFIVAIYWSIDRISISNRDEYDLNDKIVKY